MSDFASRVRELVQKAEAAGWTVAEERSIPYGRLVVLMQGGSTKATLSCYHGKKGFKTVYGGKAADDLAAALGGSAPSRGGGGSGGGPDPFGLGLPRIGGDESGKGDYFGALTVAACHVDAEIQTQLIELGVADSKRLTDPRIRMLAGRIDDIGCGHVEVLDPADYNEEYRRVGNVNLLLAEMHGRCVSAIARQVGAQAPVVIIDQFARNNAPLRGQLPRDARLTTKTKAEADPVVAAASILARAAFVESLDRLAEEFGTRFPPGAGDPVLVAGRQFVRTFGAGQLSRVAKVHFATTQKVS